MRKIQTVGKSIEHVPNFVNKSNIISEMKKGSYTLKEI